MELESILQASRGVMNLATFLIVASFYDRTARYRPLVSIVATGIAGFSAALATWTAFNLWKPTCICTTPSGTIQEFLLVGMFAILLGLVVRSKGNVAKLLPWKYHQ
ncbi:hypothetical protein D3C85_765200 [compost metagenome]